MSCEKRVSKTFKYIVVIAAITNITDCDSSILSYSYQEQLLELDS